MVFATVYLINKIIAPRNCEEIPLMNGEDQHLESPRFKIWYREYIIDHASENSWDNRVEILVARFRALLNVEPGL